MREPSPPFAMQPPTSSRTEAPYPINVRQEVSRFHAIQSAMLDAFLAFSPEQQEHLLRRGEYLQTQPPAPGSFYTGISSSAGSAPRTAMQMALNPPARSSRSAPSTASSSSSAHGQWPPSTSSSTSSSSRAGSSHAPPVETRQVHRVYVLNCATCHNFVSDRGMRAVLLLKPNIILFSTDASPCNAGPLYPNAPPPTPEPQVDRTCDCLTQSIGCHGCGSVLGYHIVSPCTRCTESVAKHQRTANHHRFVFHHNEVVARERKYVEGERGVLPDPWGAQATAAARPASRASTPVPERHAEDKDGGDGLRPSYPVTARPPSSPSEAQLRAASSRSRTMTSSSGLMPPLAGVLEYRGLQDGDTVYWHHLNSGGERVEPIDPDTRKPRAVERPGR